MPREYALGHGCEVKARAMAWSQMRTPNLTYRLTVQVGDPAAYLKQVQDNELWVFHSVTHSYALEPVQAHPAS